MINIIEGTKLANLCDYSFGDQASIICNIYGGYMKDANIDNIEFVNRLKEVSTERNYMTLFIDNIRLYKREILLPNIHDQNWVNMLMEKSDLLYLCSLFPNMNFIIFTNLEDTSIDEGIKDKIPKNVISINAVNAKYSDNIVHTFPYGIQRKMGPHDNKENILAKMINTECNIEKLLYINHNITTNHSERSGINEMFNNYWSTVDRSRQDYSIFLSNIKKHKFMICPIGNAIDCHRNWEVLYLNRIPIMKYNKYLEEIFKDFPVLFVENYSNITEDLLSNFNPPEPIDINKLNLDTLFNIRIKEAISRI